MGPTRQEGTSACHIFQCSQAHGWGVSSLQQHPGNSIGAPVHKAPTVWKPLPSERTQMYHIAQAHQTLSHLCSITYIIQSAELCSVFSCIHQTQQ